MNTPIYDFVREYAKRQGVRFHMPGHKGRRFLGIEDIDLTEISGADVLSEAQGIIGESETNAASLFGTAKTLYSTEGSTLAIKTMLCLATKGKREDRPKVLAARNVHKAFIYAAALLDLEVEWIYPDEPSHICTCGITPEQVENAILSSAEKPCALYLTSPDYLGNRADIKGISAVCKRHKVLLLVDNAHGAYLKFLPEDSHPITLGADACCDSAHKTLPVLTGGAYLHISKNAPKSFCENAKSTMALFGSTSPSYLTMSSLDLCNRYLCEGYGERLAECIERVNKTKIALKEKGFAVEEGEPLKIVVRAQCSGYTGEELGNALREKDIEPEFCDRDFLVLMATPENSESDFERLTDALSGIELSKEAQTETCPAPPVVKAKAVRSIRDAVLSEQEIIPSEDAEGRVCASPTVSCPPAVPIAVSGELVTKETVSALLYYGIDHISVIK